MNSMNNTNTVLLVSPIIDHRDLFSCIHVDITCHPKSHNYYTRTNHACKCATTINGQWLDGQLNLEQRSMAKPSVSIWLQYTTSYYM